MFRGCGACGRWLPALPIVQFKKLFDASDPQKSKLPPRWEAKKLSLLQRMCILRCLRPAKITLAVQVGRPSCACLYSTPRRVLCTLAISRSITLPVSSPLVRTLGLAGPPAVLPMSTARTAKMSLPVWPTPMLVPAETCVCAATAAL